MIHKKKFIRIGLVSIIVLLIIAACSPKPQYGYPTDALESIGRLEYEQITDLVLFTYVPQEEDKRQTVLVNTKTKKQYNIDEFKSLKEGFYDVRYLDNKMIIQDNMANQYIVYNDVTEKGVFKQIFTATDNRYVIDFDKVNNMLTTIDMEKNEVVKIDLAGNKVSAFNYKDIGEYEAETGDLLGYFGFNGAVDKLLFFGRLDNKESQLASFNVETNKWELLPLVDKTDEYIPSISFIHKNYFVLYISEDNVFYFTDLLSKERYMIEAPMSVPYSSKLRDNRLEALHDNSLIFSTLNLEPSNVSVNESYQFSQIIQDGIQRVNRINVNTTTELVFSTPEGLYRYDKATKELETIIFMDVGNE